MKRLTLATNSVLHYWRSHLGVALGTLFATMALTGSLIVGDCVDATLQSTALQRLGSVQFAMSNSSRLMREELAYELTESLDVPTTPVFHVRSIIRKGDGSRSANNISLYGIRSTFWELGSTPLADFQPFAETNDGVVLNEALANHLNVQLGDQVVLRIENPSAISRDVPLSTVDDAILAFRLPIVAIADRHTMGRFGLNANQITPYNAFIPLSYIQEKTENIDKINTLLIGSSQSESISLDKVNAALTEHWTLADAQLSLNALSQNAWQELRTERIFLEPTILPTLNQTFLSAENNPVHTSILTYFVSGFRLDEKFAPYSMVSAIEEHNPQNSIYPDVRNLNDNEMIINQWLADDLDAKLGSEISLTYTILGPMRKLIERERSFVVSKIIPMSHPLCDPALMPDFPGIADSEHCRDWDPGFIIDLDKIRDKDETYWERYKGTPKAFVSLTAGQEMWSNRYGNLTAIRFNNGDQSNEQFENQMTQSLSPNDFGLLFSPVRETALKAVNNAMSFGSLFIGLSFFVILSAVILTALLFVFGADRRSKQTGLLFALGFTTKQIRRLSLLEGLLVAIAGSVLGTFIAVIYARLMIWALSTVWSGAVAGIDFEFALSLSTLMIGLASGTIISMVAIGLVIRRQAKDSIHSLLSTQQSSEQSWAKPNHKGFWIAGASALMTLALFLFVSPSDPMVAAGQFFGIGALLLIAGQGMSHAYLSRIMSTGSDGNLTLSELGKRNIGRRRGRSLAVIGLLASGCFLMIAVGANRHDALTHADSRSSGTGGFAFYAETTLPLFYDLNTEAGCNEFGLSREDIPNLSVVPLRLRDGDDASCLNLNRAQSPKLLGVESEMLASRDAFRFVQAHDDITSSKDAWQLLNTPLDDGTIPAIADKATAMWALGKSLGDTLTYTDEHGQTFDVRLVGLLANSVFQGSLIISETAFVQRFPSSSGYRIMLMDSPLNTREESHQTLTNALQDIGIEITPAPERLAAFLQVENTYLAIFQILGGLGLILGCAGMGVVVMRNTLERHSEFALMRAIGFTPESIRRMIINEHRYLLIAGLSCGALSGLIASVPAMRFHASTFPFLSLTLTLALIVLSGLFGIYLASNRALRENVVAGLRQE